MKRFISLLIACIYLLTTLPAASAAAIPVGPPPNDVTTSPGVLISAFASDDSLEALELYNQTSAPIKLAGWQVGFGEHFSDCDNQSFSAALPASTGWLLPKSYITLENANNISDSTDSILYFNIPLPSQPGCSEPSLKTIILRGTDGSIVQTIDLPLGTPIGFWQQHQRGNSSSSTRTFNGNFSDDYKLATSSFTFYSAPLYSPPTDASGLQILEVLPHARDCSPLDNTSPDCADYIKLFNPTNSSIDLSSYRLRIGHKGQSESVTNTFDFSQTLAPSTYLTLATRDDGAPLGITDSGGYIWLEDTAGVKIYEPAIEYPSASSIGKIGAAWAFDGNSWQWTATPKPFGANLFTPLAASGASSSSSSPKPCAADQYRNPLTNRCKLIITASTLVACLPTQFRNPETNRCNNLASATSSLKPCAANQVRNPATSRCKSTTTMTSSLKPCQPGWTRNPDTNRCRKGSPAANDKPQIQDVKDTRTARSMAGWLIALAAIAVALGYAVWEWRQEIADRLLRPRSRLRRIVPNKKP